MLQVGDRAPDFTLLHSLAHPPIHLHGSLGERPIVLLFFPQAFSPVCTEEICMATVDLSRWAEMDALILGLSVDSFWVTERFARECGAEFPILSDFNKEAATAYGVLNPDYFGLRGVADRSVFLIDQLGTIVYAWSSRDPSVLPDFQTVRDAVQALRAPDEGRG